MNPAAATANIFDVSSLSLLKQGVKSNDPEALKAAARQFEALFLQMVLKSMRDAVPQDGMFDSDQTRMYESLLDQQLAQVMSSKGTTGLAAMLVKQLSNTPVDPVPPPEQGLPLSPSSRSLPIDGGRAFSPAPSRENSDASLTAGAVTAVGEPAISGSVLESMASNAREFVNRVWPHAIEAGKKTGVPAHFMVAHAALETGWGKSEPRFPDGRPSYNLFGIKAGRQWGGASVEASTTEYVNGAAQRQTERFRAYGSYEEAFRDYARLLSESPRYAPALAQPDGAGFARSLQRAGYATDPMYAAKLERIISGPTLRQALSG